MHEDWEVLIQDEQGTIYKNIFVYRRRDFDNSIQVLNSNGNEVNTFEGGVPIPPTMRITREMLQKLADALDTNGFKPQKGFLEGNLEATKGHLEDMRRLVFKDTKK
jgi:hypothetical protein